MSVVEHPVTNLGARKRGSAEITILVNEDGKVEFTEIFRSMGDQDYDKAALHAVRRVKYEPAILNNYAVACWMTISVPF